MIPDELDPLESRLRDLPLRRPSPELDARIAGLRPGVSGRRVPRGAWAAVAAASMVAACLTAAVVWRSGPAAPGPPSTAQPAGDPADVVRRDGPRPSPSAVAAEGPSRPSRAEPVRIEQVWSQVRTEGIVTQDDAPPMQRLSREVVRRVRVIDDSRHVRIEWNIPSRQTVVMPLEYN